MPKHSIAVFNSGAIGSLRELLNDSEYLTTDTQLVILRDGSKFYLRVQNTTGPDPDDINDSHPCPGSPGC